MAYGVKYSLPFLNRELISCEVKFSSNDDYVGSITTLTGGEKPFELNYQAQDNEIPYGLRPSEAVIEFYADDLSLTDFYSEDDNFWKVQFYKNSILEWTGFLQLDNCSEQWTDINHTLSFNANDGLAKLQNIYLLIDQADPNKPYYATLTLQDFFNYIFAFIGSDLDTAAYLNIFENSTFDRTHAATDDLIQQTVVDTKYYINDDGTTLSLYDILNNVLTDFRACMFQASGEWVIIRPGDLRLFTSGTMPGTRYLGGWSTFEACTYPANISIGRGLAVHPINENQLTKILRPYNFVKETFNYNNPPLIVQAGLQLPKGAVPFDTNTVDGIRYDDYDISTYFPNWKEIGTADVQFLRVETIVGPPQTEQNRYIVSVFGNAVSGIRFNPIPVTKGDVIDFSLRFRTDSDVSGDLRFYVNILLVTTDCNYFIISTPLGQLSPARWAASVLPIVPFYLEPDTSGDTTQWMDFSVSMSTLNTDPLNKFIPADGMLLIDVYGTNGASDHDDYTTYWKDVSLNIYNFTNNSIQITGQTHNTTLDNAAKNNEQLTASHDDSPGNAILGTLFTNEVTNFCEDIGDTFFTRTSLWHRTDIDEAWRLGYLNTVGDILLQDRIRTILEGDFFGLTDVSLASIVNFSAIPLKNFIFGTARFDYMSCIWNATFYEFFEDGETDGETVTHEVLDTNADQDTYASTGESIALTFSDIVTNEEFTPNGAFILWTFNGQPGTVDLEVNLQGIWDSTASATMNLRVNNVIIDSAFIGTGGAFHFFTANIQQSPTLATGDVISVTINWTGSTAYSLEVQSDSWMTANRTEFIYLYDYQFNYIYQNG